jgi:hypothetical protein
LWWTVKHEWVYLRPAADGIEQKRSLGEFFGRSRPLRPGSVLGVQRARYGSCSTSRVYRCRWSHRHELHGSRNTHILGSHIVFSLLFPVFSVIVYCCSSSIFVGFAAVLGKAHGRPMKFFSNVVGVPTSRDGARGPGMDLDAIAPSFRAWQLTELAGAGATFQSDTGYRDEQLDSGDPPG